jgi:hypothetical protein
MGEVSARARTTNERGRISKLEVGVVKQFATLPQHAAKRINEATYALTAESGKAIR